MFVSHPVRRHRRRASRGSWRSAGRQEEAFLLLGRPTTGLPPAHITAKATLEN